MPKTIIRDREDERWARFDVEGGRPWIRWSTTIAEATSFEDGKAAKEAFFQALADMEATSNERADKANAKGGKRILRSNTKYHQKTAADQYVEKLTAQEVGAQIEEIKKKNLGASAPYNSAKILGYIKDAKTLSEQRDFVRRYGWWKVVAKTSDFLPMWVPYAKKNENYLFESVTAEHELLERIDLWFVRNEDGWLGQSVQKHWTSFPELHQAQPFYSKESAQSAAKAHRYNSSVLVKSSMLISSVESANPKIDSFNDQTTNYLISGCEAREIESAINQVATDRQKAFEQNKSTGQESAPSKPAATRSRI